MGQRAERGWERGPLVELEYAARFWGGAGVGYVARLVRSWTTRGSGPRFLPVTFTTDPAIVPPDPAFTTRR